MYTPVPPFKYWEVFQHVQSRLRNQALPKPSQIYLNSMGDPTYWIKKKKIHALPSSCLNSSIFGAGKKVPHTASLDMTNQ